MTAPAWTPLAVDEDTADPDYLTHPATPAVLARDDQGRWHVMQPASDPGFDHDGRFVGYGQSWNDVFEGSLEAAMAVGIGTDWDTSAETYGPAPRL